MVDGHGELILAAVINGLIIRQVGAVVSTTALDSAAAA